MKLKALLTMALVGLVGLAEAGARKTEDSILKHSEPTNAA